MNKPNANPSRRRTLLAVILASIPLLAAPAARRVPGLQEKPPLTGEDAPAGAIWLDSLDLSRMVLADGTIAAGLFNRGLQSVKMRATWKELGLSGRQQVRDLWQQKDLGVVNGEFSAVVPAHGAVLVRIGTQRAQ